MHFTLTRPILTLGTAESRLFLDLLPWLGALLGLVIVGGILMYAARRMVKSENDAVTEGFTLHSLRQLHAAGDLSDEEFERAKAAMIGHVKKSVESEEPSTGEPKDDPHGTQEKPDKKPRQDDASGDDDGPINR